MANLHPLDRLDKSCDNQLVKEGEASSMVGLGVLISWCHMKMSCVAQIRYTVRGLNSMIGLLLVCTRENVMQGNTGFIVEIINFWRRKVYATTDLVPSSAQ